MDNARFHKYLAFVVFFGFSLRILLFSMMLNSTVPRWHLVETRSDSNVTWRQAESLNHGNTWGRYPLNPERDIPSALREDIGQNFFGHPQVFFQSPLYSWVVAWFSQSPDGSTWKVLFLQLIFGTAMIWSVGQLGKRVGGFWVGLLAAFLCAACQPVLALENLLLRDALAMSIFSFGLWACEAMFDEEVRHPFLLGVTGAFLLSVGTLLRENLLLVLLGVIAASCVSAFRSKPSDNSVPRKRLAGVFLGLLVGLGPLLLRNHVVDAPLFSISNGGPVTLVAGLSVAVDADPIGYTLPNETTEILVKTHNNNLETLLELLSRASTHPSQFLRLLAKKLWGFFSPYEAADNIDLDVLTWLFPLLRWTIPFSWIALPALWGFVKLVRHKRLSRRVLWALTTQAGMMLLVPSLWRIRAGLIPLLLPIAAYGWIQVVHSTVAWRKTPRSRGLASAALGVAMLLTYLFPPKPLHRLRAVEAMSIAKVHLLDGRDDLALESLDAWLEEAKRKRVEGRVAMVQQFRDQIAGTPH